MTHFKKGDSLRVINNLDEDGEVCEGGLAARAIVYDGVSKSLKDWCDILNIDLLPTCHRIALGEVFETIVSE